MRWYVSSRDNICIIYKLVLANGNPICLLVMVLICDDDDDDDDDDDKNW